jgi:hypothetical protein
MTNRTNNNQSVVLGVFSLVCTAGIAPQLPRSYVRSNRKGGHSNGYADARDGFLKMASAPSLRRCKSVPVFANPH